MRCERDAFDTLFDCAPEKLAVVKKVCSCVNWMMNGSLIVNFICFFFSVIDHIR